MFSNFSPQTRKSLGYLFSRPERTIRSLAAVSGGATLLLSETIIPKSIHQSTLYRVTLGDFQQFLIENVAQMNHELLANVPTRQLEANFVPRRMVGSAVDAAGLLWIRLSPLWVFAIASDAAAGSQVFLQRLVAQLKANEVLPPDAQIDSLTELLAAMQTAAQQSAQAVNAPPLAYEEVAQTAVELRDSYGRLFTNTHNLLFRMDSLWSQMEEVAAAEGTSTAHISGIMTLDLVQWSKKGANSAIAVGQTGVELLDEHILSSYAHTLQQLSQEGLANYLNRMLTPFAESAINHYAPDKTSWTERVLFAEVVEKTASPQQTPPTNESTLS
jgi:hypothetical protein